MLQAPLGVLLKRNARAVAVDMQFLKRAIEEGEAAKRLSVSCGGLDPVSTGLRPTPDAHFDHGGTTPVMRA